MPGSLHLGRIRGIEIWVHFTFIFVLLLLLPLAGHVRILLLGIAWLVCLFASVLFHELAHSLLARRRGLPVRGIVLLPVGGASLIESIDVKPANEFLIAIVGPLSSAVLGGVLLGALAIAHAPTEPVLLGPPLAVGSGLAAFVRSLAWTNFALAVFNILPAFPMDGGRVLRSALAFVIGKRRATVVAGGVGTGMGALFALGGIAGGNLFLAVIGIMVALSAFQEMERARSRRPTISYPSPAAQGLTVLQAYTPDPRVLDARLPVYRVEPWVRAEMRGFPVIFEGHYLGMVGPQELEGALPNQTLLEVTDRDAPVLELAEPLVPDALAKLEASGRRELAVTWQGRIVGVLFKDVAEAMARGQPTWSYSGPYRTAGIYRGPYPY